MNGIVGKFREYAHLERKRSADGLSPRELQRWMALKRLLSREFTPEISDSRADQRSSVRVPTRLTVAFRSAREIRPCLMTNLSRGGLFVHTEHLVEIGTRVELSIRIDETGEVISLPAEVVSQNAGPQLAGDQQGMGLRFLDMEDADRKRVEDLYEHALISAALDKR